METKQGCEVTIQNETGAWVPCNKPAQIIVTVDGGPVNCCRNHSTGVIERAKAMKRKYKVEPIPPEP